jgi:hypothetical protein
MPPRPRSPCKDVKRRLPNYKALARGLPKNHKETVARHRYQPGEPGVPCRVVPEDAPGRTTCYTPDAHSERRRTCNLLVDPQAPFAPDFPTGLYLYGHPSFQGHDFVCRYKDILTFDDVDVNTRNGLPEPYSVAVLGPFPDPVTKRLTIRCVPTSTFTRANLRGDVCNLGNCFETMQGGEPDRVIIVPTWQMLDSFCLQCQDVGLYQMATAIAEACLDLSHQRADLEDLREATEGDADFERSTRTLLRSFYELALYSRRWAGPDRKVPTRALPVPVGGAGNPISAKLRGKFAIPTRAGVRLAPDGNIPADVLDGLGMLTGMQQALGQTVLQIYDSLSAHQQTLLRRACHLGYHFLQVDGEGYWLSDSEVNQTFPPLNGNPNVNGRPFPLDLFTMYFGTPSVNPRNLFAHSSVQGTNGYCVQIAGNMAGRTVLTLLPYLYRTTPVWALLDGPWIGMHT